MSSFVKGEKEFPGKLSGGVISCLINTDHIVAIFPLGEQGESCLAALDDGTTVRLHHQYDQFEIIIDAQMIQQLDGARKFLRKK